MIKSSFEPILAMAENRKGGHAGLMALMQDVMPQDEFANIPDDRILSMMCRVINQAGFNWSVVVKKWPQFEEAFHGFNTDKLAMMPEGEWEAYTKDKRVVRNGQKIKAVMENTFFVRRMSEEHGSFAKFMLTYGPDRQIELMAYLKKHGSRLGGNTGMYFLRFLGRDSFILSRDVLMAIRNAGHSITQNPTSKRDMNTIQQVFNDWHGETGLSYTYLSRIAGFSIGADNTNATIESELKKLGLD